ncbi:MAG: protein translocase subunit SecD [Chloroflexota bacterium]
MHRIGWTIAAIIVIFLAAVYVDLPQTSSVAGHKVRVNEGIDLAGGARALLCTPQKSPAPSSTDMATARQIIQSRAAGGAGVIEPQVTSVGSRCISVEMPGLRNQEILQTIGHTGYLALTDGSGTQLGTVKVKLVCPASTPHCAPGAKVGTTDTSATPPRMQVVVPGKYVQQGSAQVGYQNGNPVVNYTLTGKGSTDWCNFTSSHVHQPSGVVLDGVVQVDPTINGPICGGQTEITGLTLQQATQVATYLNYGALPVALTVNSSSQVSATLGPQYVHAALLAGVVGMIIVLLFMLLYYRLPGLLADLALLLYAAVVFALFKLFGVTLTLAGIAGFVLSIGMAVDANVLIFERMKEELRSGKTLGAAVEAGFNRAFPSIRDSNASTIITSIILFWFGHNFAASIITGFATTLIIGVVVSFLTAYFVSRTFLRIIVQTHSVRAPALFGIEPPQAAPTSGGSIA